MIKVKTYNEILEDMLSRFDDKYDKREGSMLYNLVAPAAREVAIQYTVLKSYEDINFLDTSTGVFLTRLCRQFGVERLPATASVRLVKFKQEIPLGTRFSVVNSEFNFRVLERKNGFDYTVVAEQVGNAPNYVTGQLINIDVMSEFKGAEIGQIIVLGEDEESDKALRKRTIDYLKTPTLNGNVAQYKKWASEFVGVGSALVEPLWKGANTVRVSITDADGNEATPELVSRFKNFLDPEPSGHGLGVAPIGAYVTVQSVSGFDIRIVATIKVDEDVDIDTIRKEARVQLIKYLREEAFEEKEVRNYKVATIIDRISGVKDVDRVLINGRENSVELSTNMIPKLAEVTINAS